MSYDEVVFFLDVLLHSKKSSSLLGYLITCIYKYDVLLHTQPLTHSNFFLATAARNLFNPNIRIIAVSRIKLGM